MWLSSIGGCALGLVFWAHAMAAPPNEQPAIVKIPLDEIWAYKMPSTRDVRTLERDKFAPTTEEIRKALGPTPLEKPGPIKMPAPKRGFAVVGGGRDALQQTYSVLVDKQKPPQQLPAGSEITLIFTSIQSQRYVELDEVERQGNDFVVRYRFVPHETAEVTEHFALIPLGKLPTGKHSVQIVQSPMEKKYLDRGFRPMSDADARRIVCGSFSFSVVEDDRK